MSRGLGKVERAILEHLEKQVHKGMPGRSSIPFLVASIYGQSAFAMALHQPFSAERSYSSVKRATKSLEQKGYIKRWTSVHDSCVELVKCTSASGTLSDGGS